MGSTVQNGSNDVAPQSVLNGARPNVGGRRNNGWSDSADAQASTGNTSGGVQTRCDGAQLCTGQLWEDESKRRRATGSLDKDRLITRRVCGVKGGQD